MAKKKTKTKKKARTGRTRRIARKTTGRRKTRGKTGSGRRSLAKVSLSELQAELERREREVTHLQDRRQELIAELQDIERTLSDYGALDGRTRTGRVERPRRGPGRPPGSGRRVGAPRGRRRARNKMSLVDALRKVLRGKTMSVTEVADAVQKSGYKTKSENFRTIVNQALINNPGVFNKVDRGQYTAK